MLKYNPQKVSLALNHDPVRGPFGLGSITTNADDRYDKVYTPEDFNDNTSLTPVRQFEEILNK